LSPPTPEGGPRSQLSVRTASRPPAPIWEDQQWMSG